MPAPGVDLRQREPYSRAELTAQLRAMGIRTGETLLVQSSLRAVGPVRGGAATVVAALEAALGRSGTLVAYTATPENSLTSPLHRAATADLDPAGLRAYRATMPPFDLELTPASPTMGRLAEHIRTGRTSVRSTHPQTSFSAMGAEAGWLTERHDLESHLGDESPLHRLYHAHARVLLVSVPWVCCTAFHLAEYWQPQLVPQRYGCVVTDGRGRRQWAHFDGLSLRIDHFEEMGRALVADGRMLVSGWLGDAHCYLMPIVEAVDWVNKWLRNSHS
jgi:aminoglycoside 3-N-acetyltransferase